MFLCFSASASLAGRVFGPVQLVSPPPRQPPTHSTPGQACLVPLASQVEGGKWGEVLRAKAGGGGVGDMEVGL